MTWSNRTLSGAGYLLDLTFGNGQFTILGNLNNTWPGTGTPVLNTSPDGLSWTQHPIDPTNNFFGHVAMTKAVLPIMRFQHSGHIIMLSSILGVIGQPVVSSYCASKFALEGWTEAARIEMASLGVKLVLVEPGAFKTDIWDRNVVISQGALAPDSPNKERSRRFTDGVKKTEMGDAWDVARLIVRIAQNPNPSLRYRIGRDAALGYWMRRILPWNTWEKMIAKRSSIH